MILISSQDYYHHDKLFVITLKKILISKQSTDILWIEKHKYENLMSYQKLKV